MWYTYRCINCIFEPTVINHNCSFFAYLYIIGKKKSINFQKTIEHFSEIDLVANCGNEITTTTKNEITKLGIVSCNVKIAKNYLSLKGIIISPVIIILTKWQKLFGNQLFSIFTIEENRRENIFAVNKKTILNVYHF